MIISFISTNTNTVVAHYFAGSVLNFQSLINFNLHESVKDSASKKYKLLLTYFKSL